MIIGRAARATGACLALLVPTATAPAGATEAAVATTRGRIVTFTAAPGQANTVEVTVAGTTTDGYDDYVVFRIDDRYVIAASGNCSHPDDADRTVVECLARDDGPSAAPVAVVHLGDGNDRGHVGDNGVVHGEAGRDYLAVVGRAGAAYGGPGDDELHGGWREDRLYGGRGDDLVYGSRGRDVMDGNSGDDVMLGNNGDDTLRGGPGRDTLLGGPGTDVLDGGPGRDEVSQD